MNTLTRILAACCSLFIVNSGFAAPEYDLVNMIGDPIVVKINQERVDNKDYYQIIFPGKTVKQTYPLANAYCLKKLAWAPYDKTAPLNGGLDLVDKTSGRIPESKQREFGDKVAQGYAFTPMEIIMQPNELFQKTRKAAAELLKGIDAFACQTLQEVKDFSVPGGNLGGGGGGGFGGDGSGGKETKVDKTGQLIELLENLKTAIEEIQDSMTSLEKAKMTNKIANMLTSENIKLLTTIGKLQPLDITTIKNAVNAQGKALGLVEFAIEILAQREIKIDINTALINTSFDGGGGMGMGSSSGGGNKGKCTFGLGTIGKAGGKLAGYTLCKSREFIIYFKVDSDGIPMMSKYGRIELTATTVEGQ